MAKTSKDFEQRMSGMLYAYNIANEQGVDALYKEIKMRNYLKAPLGVPKKELEKFMDSIEKNMYTCMLAVVCMTLHDVLGFGKKRLHRIKEKFDEKTEEVFKFDYLGNHYVTLDDYAVYLNKEFDLGLDVERTAACQHGSSTEQEFYRKANIDDVLRVLKNNGYEDAAEFLENKIA